MTKFKKIIPALCMLLISAVLMGTSTYAWFSMNTSVSAKGMSISASSDSTFLVIKEGSTFDASTTTTEVTSSASAATLKPVAPVSDTFANKTAVETAANWHYAYSNAPTSSAKDGEYTVCENLTGYVANETFSIGLSNASGVTQSANNLRLSSITIPANSGIAVVVVCNDKATVYRATNTSASQDFGIKATKDGAVVTVYYFIDGDNTNVYTNNIAALTGQVSLKFTVDAA